MSPLTAATGAQYEAYSWDCYKLQLPIGSTISSSDNSVWTKVSDSDKAMPIIMAKITPHWNHFISIKFLLSLAIFMAIFIQTGRCLQLTSSVSRSLFYWLYIILFSTTSNFNLEDE